MFKIGDNVVYPMHGAGTIVAIEEKEILGNTQKYYVMRLSLGEMKVMIPLDNAHRVGLRQVIDREEVAEVYDILHKPCTTSSANWNRRYMVNLEKIKTGNVLEVAEVVKNLLHRDKEKGLSTGEKKMLDSAKQILISELVLAKDQDPDETAISIDQVFSS